MKKNNDEIKFCPVCSKKTKKIHYPCCSDKCQKIFLYEELTLVDYEISDMNHGYRLPELYDDCDIDSIMEEIENKDE